MRTWYESLTSTGRLLVRLMAALLALAVPAYALGLSLLFSSPPATQAQPARTSSIIRDQEPTHPLPAAPQPDNQRRPKRPEILPFAPRNDSIEGSWDDDSEDQPPERPDADSISVRTPASPVSPRSPRSPGSPPS